MRTNSCGSVSIREALSQLFLQPSTLIHVYGNGQTVLCYCAAHQYPAVLNCAFILFYVSADACEVLEDVNNV